MHTSGRSPRLAACETNRRAVAPTRGVIPRTFGLCVLQPISWSSKRHSTFVSWHTATTPACHPMNPTLLSTRLATLAGLTFVLAASSGCRSYSPQPLELSSHAAAFLARLPELPAAPSAPSDAPASASRTFDPSDGLSLPEAEAVALVFNASLRVARLDAGVAAAAASNAGLWEDPVLGVDLARIIQSAPHPWKLASSVGLTIPVSGLLTALKEEADAEHRASLTRVARDEWQVRMDLRRAWLRHAALEARRATRSDQLRTADQVQAIVARMEEAGEIGRTEARLFRIERAGEASQLATIEAQLDASALAIRELMGLAPQASVQLVVGDSGQPEGSFDRSLEELTQAALEGNQSLSVAEADYAVAERALAREIRRQYPDLQLGPGYGREDGDDQALLSFSLPLPLLNANRQGIAKAAAAREVAREHANAAIEQLVADLAMAQAALRAARAQRRLLESELIPLTDAQYADARALAQLGEINTLILLEALKRQHEARTAHIEALLEESLAMLRIEELVGPISRAASSAAHPIDTSTMYPGPAAPTH